MSFYGRKFRRTHYENVDEFMLSTTSIEEKLFDQFRNHPPTVCFTKLDEDSIQVELENESKHYIDVFKLGEAKELQRLDGKKIKMTYTQEGDNVLTQVLRMPDGKEVTFKREFEGNGGKMTVTLEGRGVSAYIYFKELV